MNDILQYKDYYASIHFNAEDEVFHGKILGINDLVNFEGSSVRELKRSFREAVEDYLETCKEVGKEPDKTYKGTFNVRIPADLHKDAAVFAAINNVSLNDFVKTAISYALLHRNDLNRQMAIKQQI
jgi:predicted HicB family RNase H-like nuclease